MIGDVTALISLSPEEPKRRGFRSAGSHSSDVFGGDDNLKTFWQKKGEKGIFFGFSASHTRTWPPLVLHNEHVKPQPASLFISWHFKGKSMQNLTCLLYHQRSGSQICPRCIRAKTSHRRERGCGGWQVAQSDPATGTSSLVFYLPPKSCDGGRIWLRSFPARDTPTCHLFVPPEHRRRRRRFVAIWQRYHKIGNMERNRTFKTGT